MVKTLNKSKLEKNYRNFDGTTMKFKRGVARYVALPKAHPGPRYGRKFKKRPGPHQFVVHINKTDDTATKSHIRLYAMGTNVFFRLCGARTVQRTRASTLYKDMSTCSTKERKGNKHLYRGLIVGHWPDAAVSGSPYGGHCWLPMTKRANTRVGRPSPGSRISQILVQEPNGELWIY
jgi:hypothetical protein